MLVKLVTIKTFLSDRAKSFKSSVFRESDIGGGVISENCYRLLLRSEFDIINTLDYKAGFKRRRRKKIHFCPKEAICVQSKNKFGS